MIQRANIKCLTCNTVSTLRIDIGHSKEQEHVLHCSGCEEEIKVKLDLSNPPNVGFSCVNNCELCEEEGIIENLSSENQVPEEYRHDPRFSPGIFASRLLFEQMEKTGKEISNEEYQTRVPEAERALLVNVEWPIIKRAWSQFNKNNLDLANNIAKQNSKQYPEAANGALHWIYDFCLRILSNGKLPLFGDAQEKIHTIADKFEKQFDSYLVYHDETVLGRLKKYYAVFEKFFDSYDEYSQIFLTHKLNKKILPGALSSYNFPKTRDFYGFTFEVLGAGAVTFAALQNIDAGRDYNLFETENFKLEDYLKTDKSNRTKCFERIPEFANVYSEYSAPIRNGAQHATFEYDSKKKIISYQPKKDPEKIYEINYFDYINSCVELLFSCATMVCVDIMLHYISQLKSKK